MKDHQAWKWAVDVIGATTIALATHAVLAAMPHAPKCTHQNFTMSYTDMEVLDPAPAGYPFCVKTFVHGTINGAYVSCALNDVTGDFGPGGMSMFNLGPVAGDFSMYANEWIETREGKLKLYTFGVSNIDTQLQTFLSRVVPGSSGRYAGATGVLAGVPQWETYDPASGDPFAGKLRVTGYLCTP